MKFTTPLKSEITPGATEKPKGIPANKNSPKHPHTNSPQKHNTAEPSHKTESPGSVALQPSGCEVRDCDHPKERPNIETGATVYVVFGVDGVVMKHSTEGHVVDDEQVGVCVCVSVCVCLSVCVNIETGATVYVVFGVDGVVMKHSTEGHVVDDEQVGWLVEYVISQLQIVCSGLHLLTFLDVGNFWDKSMEIT